MLRLSTNMKLRNYHFIPPMGRLASDILSSSVKISKSDGTIITMDLSEYLLNKRGISTSGAVDGTHYSEVIDGSESGELFRALATKYVPAGASFSTGQPLIYVSTDNTKSSFRIVSFEDKSLKMTESDIVQMIQNNDRGYTIQGQLASVKALNAVRIFTLKDGTELVWKPEYSLTYVKMHYEDGGNPIQYYNPSNAFLFWELVDRNVPDSDIVDLLTNHINVSDGLDNLESKLESNIQQAKNLADRVEMLMYQLDSTKNTINFLATKIDEQKDQIAAVQSYVSSSASQLRNTIDHIDIEQGSNYIKLEDLSKSVQGINYALTQLAVLPSKVESSLDMDQSIIKNLESIKSTLNQLIYEPPEDDTHKSDKMLITITVINLLLQIITIITRKEKLN